MNKEQFLKEEFAKHLAQIPADSPALFGKMNVHQMIEHMGYAFKQASGSVPLEAIGDADTTEKMYRFMMSDKPFRDNTPNPYLPDTPAAPIANSIAESLVALQKDIENFFSTFKDDEEMIIPNPFFGNLNRTEWIHLLHKHAHHHLRQFGIDLN